MMNETILNAGRSQRILLFDEHSLSRHGAAAALAEANRGWRVVAVSGLAEFLRHLGAETWELVMVDLPTLAADAEELLQVWRDNCPASKIVVLNGPENDARRAELTAAGADGYLSRSAPLSELSRLAAALLGAPRPELAGLRGGLRSPGQANLGFQSNLTDRQVAVLRLMSEGRSTKEIARRLGLAVGTVKVHLSGTYRALGAHSRVEALAKAGMIEYWGQQLA